MSPVEFKKRLCRPVEFKGQGPQRYPQTPGGHPGVNYILTWGDVSGVRLAERAL